jgi:hypothetical protein
MRKFGLCRLCFRKLALEYLGVPFQLVSTMTMTVDRVSCPMSATVQANEIAATFRVMTHQTCRSSRKRATPLVQVLERRPSIHRLYRYSAQGEP